MVMTEKENEKDERTEIEKKLFEDKKSAYELLSANEKKEATTIAEDYKKFLGENKSERNVVTYFEELAKKKGFVELSKATKENKKIYAINHSKNILLADLGAGKIEEGLKIIGSHIDVLRLDLKASPIYESGPFAMINLHYYGGIKKYHWLNVPLSMSGVVFLKNGKKVEISVGEKEDEPVFVITDLLPHLEKSESGEPKSAKDIIKGEDMDALAGSIPIDDKKTKEKIKANFLNILNKKYGIVEGDFFAAEVSLYPALKPRDVGIDASMIGGAGQDDRICSYSAVKALFDGKIKSPSVVLLVDKEEIGSVGNTSMDSFFLENVIEEISTLKNTKVSAKKILSLSKAISGDVTGATDSKFIDKFDPMNCYVMGYGVAVEKCTGSGGKYYGSDANAEYIQHIVSILDNAKVPWQTGELGKVDQGGGGTIAYMLAKYNMNIVDMGPPILAMHSPFEISSKVDLYCTYRAYKAFFES
jgi:aspartyl aminopeptidase